MPDSDSHGVSRRRVLRTTGGTAAGLALVGTAAADHEDDHDGSESAGNGNGSHNGEHGHGHGEGDEEECHYTTIASEGEHHGGGEHDEEEHGDALQEHVFCPDHPHATTEPGHTMHHVNAVMGACPTGLGLDDDCDEASWPACTNWPRETVDLIEESREALTGVYNDLGTLLARGYIPYFDVATPGATGGVSHWLNPDYIGDGYYEPNPYRPDAIILDNMWWKPIGPMYIATDEGDVRWKSEEEGVMEVREAWGYENDCGECFPYHPHDGVSGRFAWWYYRQVHEADYASGEQEDVMLPCYTAPMMHAWIYPTPDGPHSATAGAPPPEYRPDGPPNQPGYPAPATPGEDELSLEVLPEAVRRTAMPERLHRELEIVDELPTETLETTPITDLEGLMDERLGPVGDDLDAVGSLDWQPAGGRDARIR